MRVFVCDPARGPRAPHPALSRAIGAAGLGPQVGGRPGRLRQRAGGEALGSDGRAISKRSGLRRELRTAPGVSAPVH